MRVRVTLDDNGRYTRHSQHTANRKTQKRSLQQTYRQGHIHGGFTNLKDTIY